MASGRLQPSPAPQRVGGKRRHQRPAGRDPPTRQQGQRGSGAHQNQPPSHAGDQPAQGHEPRQPEQRREREQGRDEQTPDRRGDMDERAIAQRDEGVGQHLHARHGRALRRHRGSQKIAQARGSCADQHHLAAQGAGRHDAVEHRAGGQSRHRTAGADEPQPPLVGGGQGVGMGRHGALRGPWRAAAHGLMGDGEQGLRHERPDRRAHALPEIDAARHAIAVELHADAAQTRRGRRKLGDGQAFNDLPAAAQTVEHHGQRHLAAGLQRLSQRGVARRVAARFGEGDVEPDRGGARAADRIHQPGVGSAGPGPGAQPVETVRVDGDDDHALRRHDRLQPLPQIEHQMIDALQHPAEAQTERQNQQQSANAQNLQPRSPAGRARRAGFSRPSQPLARLAEAQQTRESGFHSGFTTSQGGQQRNQQQPEVGIARRHIDDLHHRRPLRAVAVVHQPRAEVALARRRPRQGQRAARRLHLRQRRLQVGVVRQRQRVMLS